MIREKNHGINIGSIVSVLFGIVCIVGLVLTFLFCKQEMDLYQAHEWTTVKAAYIQSNSYTETERDEDADGNVEEVERTYYNWLYEYEIDGKMYECVVTGKSGEKPYEGQNTRTIMVATDDYTVYMLYENEEDFKNSYKSGIKFVTLVWLGVFCFFIVAIIIKKRMFQVLCKLKI